MFIKVYGELCRATLAGVVLLCQQCAEELAKMQLKTYLERDRTGFHRDVPVGLTNFEQKPFHCFSFVEIKGGGVRKVAILLSFVCKTPLFDSLLRTVLLKNLYK